MYYESNNNFRYGNLPFLQSFWFNIFPFAPISGVRSIGIYIYISYNFIKIKYSRPNWFVLVITNNRSFRILF